MARASHSGAAGGAGGVLPGSRVRLARKLIGWPSVRWDTVTGHQRTAPDAGSAACEEEHFLIARPGPGCFGGTRAAWSG